ncbi:MAG: RluA family pseudouridine synthase [Clostridia bacterium]|nr:RluA family pseudouridine synthase [Clostridia bacterium]
MKEFVFTVEQKFNNYKCIDFLKSISISAEIIGKVKFGGVFVGEKQLSNINERVNAGAQVKIVLPLDEPNPYITPQKSKLDIVFEDEYMLAVNKHKGVLTHSSKSNSAPSLEEMVCGYFLPNPFTFRAINRLDRDTSGIVLIAKDMLTASFLGEQMKRGEIKKTYSALVVGRPNAKHFIIEKPIKRQSENSMKRVVADDGQFAKTECFVVGETKDGFTQIDLKLHTGRTHQIRVHLSSIGLPLYADALYGEKVEEKTYTLHAKCLEFTHPFTKEHVKLICEL